MLFDKVSIVNAMEEMRIRMVSLVERHGRITARARATAASIGAQIWIKVEFERSEQEPWQEARDRVLALLDIS